MSPREEYEHACWDYLLLAFHLAPMIEQNFPPAFEDIRQAAEMMRRKRVVLVASTV